MTLPEKHDPISSRQVAPRPTDVQDNVDRRQAARDLLAENPHITADEIVRRLAEKNIEVSAILVAQELSSSRSAAS